MGVVPVADKDLVGIEALFFLEEVVQLGVAGEDLIARGPFVVGEIIGAAVIDGDLDEGAKGSSGLLEAAGGVFDAQIQNDAGPGFARPREEGFVVALDEADGAVDDVPAIAAGEDADAVEKGGEILAGHVELGDHLAMRASGVGAGIDLLVIALGVVIELLGVGPIDLSVGGGVVFGVFAKDSLLVDMSEQEHALPIFAAEGFLAGGWRLAERGVVTGENSAAEEVI